MSQEISDFIDKVMLKHGDLLRRLAEFDTHDYNHPKGDHMSQRIEDIKELRVRTSLPLRDVIEIYDKTGNLEDAIELAKKSGINTTPASNASDLKSHRLYSYVHNGRIGVLVELACDTDFALNTKEFIDFSKEVCLQIVGSECCSVDELMRSFYVRNESQRFADKVREIMDKMKENVGIVRFVRYEIGKGE